MLAERAEKFHYDDYFCPDDIDDGMNIHRLIRDVMAWVVGRGITVADGRARALVFAATEGEFDGTLEEAKAWQASPDGQALFAELLRGRGGRG